MSLIAHLATQARVPEYVVAIIAKTAKHRYKKYKIPKRSGDDFRIVYHPSRPLKLFQRLIVRDALASLPVHTSATAYEKGCSPRKNAERHRFGKYFLKMDFENFFPSISDVDVNQFLQKNRENLNSYSSDSDIDLITKIICKDDQLVIGAPSSPRMSNSILYEFDKYIDFVCHNSGVTYTRYADDLTFSSKTAGKLFDVEDVVTQFILNSEAPKLTLNRFKSVHTSKKHRVTITGLNIDSSCDISLGRQNKKKIKSLIHKYDMDKLGQPEIDNLYGLLSYSKGTEPKFFASLTKKYGEALIFKILNMKPSNMSRAVNR